jgi:hypothetical protein
MASNITTVDSGKRRQIYRNAASGRTPGEILLVTEFNPDIVAWQEYPIDEVARPNRTSTFLAIVIGTGSMGIDVLALDRRPRDGTPAHHHRMLITHPCLHVHCKVADLPLIEPRLCWQVGPNKPHMLAWLIHEENRQWIHENGERLAGVLEAAIAAG